nr:MAG TPA: hypothetical protein [Caudoviricetes sp.]
MFRDFFISLYCYVLKTLLNQRFVPVKTHKNFKKRSRRDSNPRPFA